MRRESLQSLNNDEEFMNL